VPDTEITLQSLIRIFTRRWRRVVGFSVLVLIVVYLASLVLLEDQYTASVTLLVSKSKVGEKTMPFDYTMLELDTYVSLVKNRDSLVEALEIYALDEPPFGYRLEELEDCVEVRQPRNTDLLALEVTLPDPVKAREVARFLVQRATEQNLELLQLESKQSRDMFHDEVLEAHQTLIQAASNLSGFMKQARTTTSEAFIENAQKAIWNLKQDRAFNIALQDESKARVEILNRIVADLPEIRELKRAISSEQEFQDLLRQRNPDLNLEDLLSIEMKNESFDLSHYEAKKAWIEASGDLHGASAHVAAMSAEIDWLEEQIRVAEQELAMKTRFEEELKIASFSYEDIAKRDAEARSTITSERQKLTVIEHAMAPERPSGPNRLAIALSAALFAFLLALFVSLGIELYAVMEPGPPASG